MRRVEGQDGLGYPPPGEPLPDEQAGPAASAGPGSGGLPSADRGLTTRQIAEATAQPPAGGTEPATGPVAGETQTATGPVAGGTETTADPVAGETQTAAGRADTAAEPVDRGTQTTANPMAADPMAGETELTAEPGVGQVATAAPVAGRGVGGPGADAPGPGASAQPAQLLAPDELQAILGRWREIQAGFVDEPRQAVQDADRLVADLMQRLARMFATEREQLEARWSAGDSVSTEDLRLGLQRYRSFFERLLAA
jgi:hypothetical protein